jgi:hypothetical protein
MPPQPHTIRSIIMVLKANGLTDRPYKVAIVKHPKTPEYVPENKALCRLLTAAIIATITAMIAVPINAIFNIF